MQEIINEIIISHEQEFSFALAAREIQVPFSLSFRTYQNTDLVFQVLHYVFHQDCHLNCVELNLAHNKLGDLPAVLGKYTALEVLDLSDNELLPESLPKSIFYFPQLQILNLSANRIQKFKTGSDPWNLPELRVLELSSIGLKILPDLSLSRKLEVLNLCSNSLSTLSVTTFSHFKCLKELRLSGQTIGEENLFVLLSQLPTLEKLDLASISYLEYKKSDMAQNDFYFLPSFLCALNFNTPIKLILSYRFLNCLPELRDGFSAIIFSFFEALLAIPLDGQIIARNVIAPYLRDRFLDTYPDVFTEPLNMNLTEKETQTQDFMDYIHAFKKKEFSPLLDYFTTNRLFAQASRTKSGKPLYYYDYSQKNSIMKFLIPVKLVEYRAVLEPLEAIQKLGMPISDAKNRKI